MNRLKQISRMRASTPAPALSRVSRQLELSWRIDEVRGEATPEICGAILDSADRFARAELEPLNDAMDRLGCRLEEGRVRMLDEHRAVWQRYVADGWTTLEAPIEHNGQGLPTVLSFAAQELFDRANPAFGMLPVSQRSAFRLIRTYGDEALQSEWLDGLASGELGATICVSEPGAGSDLPRIRTRAEEQADGSWRVSGEKCWISFGDHDLTERIGHVVLAQTDLEDGTARASLIFVPAVLPSGARNGVVVRRLEEKLGLHGSPTCALGFEEAEGVLLGEPGRGLQQMFVMIANMRLAVGAMGLGIASAAADVAVSYAEERRQGGRPEPVLIAEHADVQLQLLDMLAPVHLLRGLLYTVANCSDLAARGDEIAQPLNAWLLPIIKTLGGEIPLDVSSAAIQVLGGAGYTREWPVEQFLRDARVLTIFEGTTGIQAQDLVHRRLLGDPTPYDAFLTEASKLSDPRLMQCLEVLRSSAEVLRSRSAEADAGATAFLHLAGVAVMAWVAARYCEQDVDNDVLRGLADHYLDGATAEARLHAQLVESNLARVGRFSSMRNQLQ